MFVQTILWQGDWQLVAPVFFFVYLCILICLSFRQFSSLCLVFYVPVFVFVFCLLYCELNLCYYAEVRICIRELKKVHH